MWVCQEDFVYHIKGENDKYLCGKNINKCKKIIKIKNFYNYGNYKNYIDITDYGFSFLLREECVDELIIEFYRYFILNYKIDMKGKFFCRECLKNFIQRSISNGKFSGVKK